MMLIVEGTDLVGKTTFCNKLVERLQKHGPWIYSHFTRLPSTWDFPRDYFARMSRFIVQDRFHMSEIVCCQMRGEEQEFTAQGYAIVDAWARMLGAVTIVILGDVDAIGKRYTGAHRKEMYNLEQIRRQGQGFRQVVQNQFEGYRCDSDLFWTATEKHPFPDEIFVDQVIEHYLDRQEHLDESLPPQVANLLGFRSQPSTAKHV